MYLTGSTVHPGVANSPELVEYNGTSMHCKVFSETAQIFDEYGTERRKAVH
jgi:hypothetical protein